jgi:hypothetical protein
VLSPAFEVSELLSPFFSKLLVSILFITTPISL